MSQPEDGRWSKRPADRLAKLEAEQTRRAERCQQVQQEVASVRVTATLPKGAGALTVDSAGVLTELRLTAQARQLHHDDLAAEIMRTAQRAQAQLGEQVEQVAQRVAPEETALREHMVAIQRERFGAPEQARSQRPTDDTDDGASDSFLIG